MTSWLFQGNPDRFAMENYLRDRDEVLWSVNQKDALENLAVGDEVFFWKAKGSEPGAEAGAVAQGDVVERPKTQPDDAPDLWKDQGDVEAKPRARIRIRQRNLSSRTMVRSSWLEEDPVLRGHVILRTPRHTNYRLSREQADRLAELLRNTGRAWTEDESLAGLWAYKETRGQPVARRNGPIPDVALRIGRAVGGVYNKVMSFRALDPRDPRAGLTGVGAADHGVWALYFDTTSGELDESGIDRAFGRFWGRRVGTPTIEYKDFGKAPADDPDELQTFARRVRRGQTKFRDALLKVYEGRCAISGWGPGEVLEAAHIAQHANSGINDPDNGLLLRSDIHVLFDRGMIRVEPKSLRIEVSEELDGSPYSSLRGQKIRARADGGRPGQAFLEIHWEQAEMAATEER